MAISGADKIFVDVNDEINFVVEKILSSEKQRVILVVPQHAIIVSSLVSMKILAKQLAKSKKQLIIVTEDPFGLGLAERSGIVAINKVSSIVPEMWEAAQLAKETLKNKIAETKQQLLTDRGAIKPLNAPVETKAEAVEEEVPEPEPEPQPETESDVESEPEEEPMVEEEVAEDLPMSDVEMVESDAAEPEDEEVKGAINRPRREPKVVHIAGFEILAGGDITQVSADAEDAIISGSDEETTDMEEEPRSTKRPEKAKPAGGFTGRDWTNYTNDKKSLSLSNLFPFKRQPTVVPGERRPVLPSDTKPGTVDKRKVAIAVVVAMVFLFLGGGYVLAYQLSTVEVKVSLQTQQVPVQQAISADTAVTAIDAANLIVPAKLITYDQLSISASDKASGEGKSGEKAAGLIDIWNFTDQAVTIASGTVAQNTTTNLKYIIQQEVTVPAAQGSGGTVNSVGEAKDVRIVAEAFGEEYNITESGTKVDFKINGFTTDQVEGKRFRKIEGGTSTTFVAVSQEDFDRVKESLTDTLQKQGMNKITSVVPAGYRLIDGTQEFKDTESSSSPAVGEKADNFSVSLKGTVTALAISEADLQEAISLLIANNQEVGSNFEVRDLSDAVIGDVVREGEKVTFTVSSSGSLQSKVTADELKQNLAGKSIAEAENYLSHVDEIVSYKITYSPGLVPQALRFIPNDPARIQVIF